jgi:hypothetical protein
MSETLCVCNSVSRIEFTPRRCLQTLVYQLLRIAFETALVREVRGEIYSALLSTPHGVENFVAGMEKRCGSIN